MNTCSMYTCINGGVNPIFSVTLVTHRLPKLLRYSVSQDHYKHIHKDMWFH